MKTTFDKAAREQLINRINSVDEANAAQWGKMTAYQMLKHCRLWEEMVRGQIPCKRSFIGRVVGPMVLKSMTKSDTPLQHSTPTSPEIKAIEGSTGDLSAEKKKWVAYMEDYEHFVVDGFIHPFFGRMTKEEIACLAYKHADHHLRQFNA